MRNYENDAERGEKNYARILGRAWLYGYIVSVIAWIAFFFYWEMDFTLWENVAAIIVLCPNAGLYGIFFRLLFIPGLYKAFLKNLLNRFLVVSPVYIAFFYMADSPESLLKGLCLVSGLLIPVVAYGWTWSRYSYNPYEPGWYETVVCSPRLSFLSFSLTALFVIFTLTHSS